MNEKELIEKANAVRPSAAQYAFCERAFYALIHFNMNTFTNSEKGTGREPEKYFNPPEVDAAQWVRVVQNAGMKGLILTVKCEDGFCIWPTAHTEHCVKNSPWMDGEGDVVRLVADACKAQDLPFGIYISPFDLHESTFGTEAYDTYFVSLLEELLTNYGEIFCVWFPKPEDSRMHYRWSLYYETVRKLQPNAVICDCGPDIRWVGNHGGVSRSAEWSVVPYTLLNNAPAQRLVEPDLGGRRKIKHAKELVWYPALTYASIRSGFYFHREDNTNVKLLSNILDIYFRSVGNNGVFALSIPPSYLGKIEDADVVSLRTLGAQMKVEFKENLAENGTFSSDCALDAAHGADALQSPDGYWHSGAQSKNIAVTLDLGKVCFINKVVLGEHTQSGQQIEQFTLRYFFDGKWRKVYAGETVGTRKICLLPPMNARRLRLEIRKTRGFATLQTFEVY